MAKQRYFLEIAYDGAAYHGWQRQPNGITVQEVLEDAISKLLGFTICVTGQGRTDTGVHARKSYAHLDLEIELPEKLLFRLNLLLPQDIQVFRIFPVPETAHARFSALSRTYEYHLHIRKDPFLYGRSTFVFYPLTVPPMEEGARIIMQHEDFASFSRSHTQVKTTICQISEARWEQHDHRLVFTITANRFLRNMVRAVVGTLLEIGKGRRTVASLPAMLQTKTRSNAGMSAPAHGLFLVDVKYPDWVFSLATGE